MFSSQMNGLPPSQLQLEIKFHRINLISPSWEGFHPIADKLPQAISKEKPVKHCPGLKTKIVLFFGLIRKYKGLGLLTAFSKASLNDSKVIFYVVGEAYESSNKYIKLIQKLNLNKRIICDFNYANTQSSVKLLCRRCNCTNLYQCLTKWSNTSSLPFQNTLLVSDIPGLRTLF